MRIHKLSPRQTAYPERLSQIAAKPKQLYYIGAPLDDLELRPAIAIVGSRKVSAYGRQVTMQLATALARRGITIVSGLAMGVDAYAHQATVEAGGRAVAVLASGLDRIQPTSNYHLAKQILAQDGTLLSEYPEGSEPYKQNFVARNRIIAGLSQAVLITEAAEKSGSLHTANFALEQGKEVLAVPGNITSLLSVGTNNLIQAGATPITSAKDILLALNMAPEEQVTREIVAANEQEQIIFKLLTAGINEGDAMLVQSNMNPAVFNQTLTMMEITGKIKAAGNDIWMLL